MSVYLITSDIEVEWKCDKTPHNVKLLKLACILLVTILDISAQKEGNYKCLTQSFVFQFQFDQIDSNQDGLLQQSEVNGILTHVPHENCLFGFMISSDVNGDHLLSRKEFYDAFKYVGEYGHVFFLLPRSSFSILSLPCFSPAKKNTLKNAFFQ